MTLDGALRQSVKNLMWRVATCAMPLLPVPLAAYLGSRIAEMRELSRFPGWRFAVEEDNPTPLLRMRRRLWEYFKKKGIQHPVRIRWFDGLRVDLILGNDQSRCLYVGGSFEPNEMTFLSRVLRPGMVAVDAGANEGFYTLLMAKRVTTDGLVVAVEPSPRERARLQHNLAINGLRNVRVVDKGLAAERGRGVLHIADPEHNGQNTLGNFVYPGVEKQLDLEIDLEPLDETIEAVGRRPIDLIKMDVEGAELRVLRGARRILEEDAPLILFEVLDNALRAQGASAESLINFLRARGYRILKFNYDGHLAELSNVAEASSNLLAVPAAKLSEILSTDRQ